MSQTANTTFTYDVDLTAQIWSLNPQTAFVTGESCSLVEEEEEGFKASCCCCRPTGHRIFDMKTKLASLLSEKKAAVSPAIIKGISLAL